MRRRKGTTPFFLIPWILLLVAGISASELPQPTPFSVQMHTLMGAFDAHKQAVDRIARMGIRQVRDECYWSIVEKEKGKFKIPEPILRNLDYSLSKGLDTLIILDYGSPLYEHGNAPTQKESLEAFGAYCQTLARELRGKVKYFEVWNEPNADGFWRPKHDPVAYATLLKIAYREVKRGNPDAVVVGICTSGIPEDFIYAVLDQGTYDSMDVLSIHPYCHPKSPEEAQIFEKMDALHEGLKKYGKPKDLWVTEIGYPTNLSGGIPEITQAEFLARTYLLSLSVPYIKTVFWYWFGPDGPDASWAEDRFGLWHADYSPKPASTYYATVIKTLHDATFVRNVPLSDNTRCLVFRKDLSHSSTPQQQWITALWAIEGFPQIEVATTQPLQIRACSGRETNLAPRKSKCYLSASPEPLFIFSKAQLNMSLAKESRVGILLESGDNKLPRGFSTPIRLSAPPDFGTFDIQLAAYSKNLITSGTSEIVAPPDAALGIARFSIELKEKQANLPFARYTSEVTIVEPVEIDITPLPPSANAPTFNLAIRNSTDQQISGTITIRPEADVRLSKNEIPINALLPASTATFPISILSKHPEDKVFNLRVAMDIHKGLSVSTEQIISFTRCCRAEKPIVIDGVLNEWDKSLSPIRIDRQDQFTGGYVKWEGPEDSSVKLYTCWDKQYINFAVEFHDDFLSDPMTGQQVYNNDGVELYFDTDYAGDRQETRYSSDDYQYGLFIAQGKSVVWSWSQLGGESTRSKIAVNRSPKPDETISGDTFKGMIIEAAIPLDELKIEPTEGKVIGFGAAFTDDDDPSNVHPFFQEIQMTWTGRKNSWLDPHAFANLFFTTCAAERNP
jgi:hypothetical protein